MNLQGSIIERQNLITQIYRKLEVRFLENSIIHALWTEMAGDISEQVNSLKALPVSFWTQFKKDPDCRLEIDPRVDMKRPIEVSETISLRESLSLSLQVEETIILKIYAPMIRSLRKNWTNASLDFYIMVKSHVARIASVVESFAGDPLLIQQAHTLLQKFEKEIQEPAAHKKPVITQPAVTPAIQSHKAEEAPRKQAKAAKPPKAAKTSKPVKPAKSASPIKKHAKAAHNRVTPQAKKVDMTRRRVQR